MNYPELSKFMRTFAKIRQTTEEYKRIVAEIEKKAGIKLPYDRRINLHNKENVKNFEKFIEYFEKEKESIIAEYPFLSFIKEEIIDYKKIESELKQLKTIYFKIHNSVKRVFRKYLPGKRYPPLFIELGKTKIPKAEFTTLAYYEHKKYILLGDYRVVLTDRFFKKDNSEQLCILAHELFHHIQHSENKKLIWTTDLNDSYYEYSDKNADYKTKTHPLEQIRKVSNEKLETLFRHIEQQIKTLEHKSISNEKEFDELSLKFQMELITSIKDWEEVFRKKVAEEVNENEEILAILNLPKNRVTDKAIINKMYSVYLRELLRKVSKIYNEGVIDYLTLRFYSEIAGKSIEEVHKLLTIGYPLEREIFIRMKSDYYRTRFLEPIILLGIKNKWLNIR